MRRSMFVIVAFPPQREHSVLAQWRPMQANNRLHFNLPLSPQKSERKLDPRLRSEGVVENSSRWRVLVRRPRKARAALLCCASSRAPRVSPLRAAVADAPTSAPNFSADAVELAAQESPEGSHWQRWTAKRTFAPPADPAGTRREQTSTSTICFRSAPFGPYPGTEFHTLRIWFEPKR